MNYDLLAERLIDLQLSLHASTINQAMSELDKGTFFALHYLLVHQRRAYSKEISRGQHSSGDGYMAVLINFLRHINTTQFEIKGILDSNDLTLAGKPQFKKLIIMRKERRA